MSKLNTIQSRTPPNPDEILDQLARKHNEARGVGMQVVQMVGGKAEGLLDRLPAPVRNQLDGATKSALEAALRAAQTSRGVVSDQPAWMNTAVNTALGAAGGVGGLPSAMAELPVTTTVLLRAIQGAAADYGFDPADPDIQRDCLIVFSSAGPLEADDGTDTSFFAARMALSGSTVQGIIAKVAPRLGAVLGQKLAAQAVPVLGAVAGAAVNYTFTSYYQTMAQVHFGLKRLALETGQDGADLMGRLRLKIETRS
ncbi:EcsC family protein [Nereida sp. MMG025]|uniref:EcsC family protein n=1 Tax=Nereida sp. MMG025 TaxID=2909981 RepID=UPI001F291A1C|nr:EcsC family protein [Nereida sp. MMG025]MCF6445050.1 EcsC family protein [Nereida sp. MMG025]